MPRSTKPVTSHAHSRIAWITSGSLAVSGHGVEDEHIRGYEPERGDYAAVGCEPSNDRKNRGIKYATVVA